MANIVWIICILFSVFNIGTLSSVIESNEDDDPVTFDLGSNLYENHPNIKYLDLQNCGGQNSIEYPWMVYIVHTSSESGEEIEIECGGSLISDYAIITSAKCVLAANMKETKVRIGNYYSKRDTMIYEYTSANITMVPHPDFAEIEGTYFNDIALIKLHYRLPSKFNKIFINNICLPVYSEQKERNPDIMEVTGWGETETGQRAQVLMVGYVPYFPIDQCKSQIEIHGKQMCTFHKTKHVSPCDGDDGGPLQYRENYQKYYLYGVVSYYSRPCGYGPAVYTRVSKYMNFILDNITPINQGEDEETNEFISNENNI